MKRSAVGGITAALVIVVAMVVAGIVGCGREHPSDSDPQQRTVSIIANQLQIEARVRSFDFLRSGEVAVDVLLRNVGGSPVILDFRRDRRPSIGARSGIVQPHRLLDLLTFRPMSMSGVIAKEERTSNERRQRNSLEEGALLENLVQLVPLLPGQATGAAAIIWGRSPEAALVSNVRELEVEFRGLMLVAAPKEIEIKQSPLFGTILMNQEKWEAKEYSEVSAVGRFALVQ